MRLALVLVLFATAACTEPTSVPAEATYSHAIAGNTGGTIEPRPYRALLLCKTGSAATFDVAVDGAAPTQVSLLDGQCSYVHTWDGVVTGSNSPSINIVTVTELALPGYQLDSIVKDSTRGIDTYRLPTITDSRSVVASISSNKGAAVHFYNSILPPSDGGSEGCTPGYWKQTHHFDSWPAAYSPGMPFSDVFVDAFPGKSLLDVLSQGGGGLSALGRHAVAALLSSDNLGVDYGMSSSNVISEFNAAFASGEIESLHLKFEGFNERGCPLS